VASEASGAELLENRARQHETIEHHCRDPPLALGRFAGRQPGIRECPRAPGLAGQSIRRQFFPELDEDANLARVLMIDLENRTVEYAPGGGVPIEPFWGVIGVAQPPEMGRVSSGPPNFFGGNMDYRDLSPGSTVPAGPQPRRAALEPWKSVNALTRPCPVAHSL
jgi:hypothetical protein